MQKSSLLSWVIYGIGACLAAYASHQVGYGLVKAWGLSDMTRRARQYEKSLGLGAGTIEVNIPNIERLRGNLTDTVTMIVGHQYPWLFANVAGAVALRLLGILTAWPALAVVVLVGLLRSTVSVALVFLMVQLKPDKAFSIRDHG